jgi:8-oxo-dGTP diphosphatase
VRRLSDIDWTSWQGERATLLFVVDGARVLLIEKKRGLGAGKVNAPGGRIEPGEEPIAGAVREVIEETGVVPGDVRKHGELRFQFVDGYALDCEVFRAGSHRGVAIETDEAVPLWTPLDAIPYHRMWVDDALWLPILLAGDSFSGRFVFDGDAMLDYELIRRPG